MNHRAILTAGTLGGIAAVITAIATLLGVFVTDEKNETPSLIQPEDTKISPEGDAGNPKTVIEGEIVTLDGTGSYDPDGHIVSYEWIQTDGIPVTLNNAEIVNPKFEAPTVKSDTLLKFILRVIDNNGQISKPDIVGITIRDINQIPLVNDKNVLTTQNKSEDIALEGIDQDKDLLSFSLITEPLHGKIIKLDNSMSKLRYIPSPKFVGTDRFEFKANDGKSYSNTGIVTIIISKPKNELQFENDQQIQYEFSQNKSPSIIVNNYSEIQNNIEKQMILMYESTFIPEQIRNPGLKLYTHSIKVWIDGPTNLLLNIQNVTYYPEEGMTSSNRPDTKYSLADRFAISFNAFEELKLQAEINFKHGFTKVLSRNISLR